LSEVEAKTKAHEGRNNLLALSPRPRHGPARLLKDQAVKKTKIDRENRLL
jgi:hypothetical protein